jgi:hypothetical protein
VVRQLTGSPVNSVGCKAAFAEMKGENENNSFGLRKTNRNGGNP